MENYYQLLEIDKNASGEIISKVFKYHIKKNHPDLFTGEEKIKAEQKVKKLNEAYEILSNPEKRKIYDEELKALDNSILLPLQNQIDTLNKENNQLKHDLYNYNRFIYDYFYNNADQVFAKINSYNLEQTPQNPFPLDNDQNTQENTITNIILNKLKIFAIYTFMICIVILIISIVLNINLFKIIFTVFFK